jgi:hypothetical protein
MERKLFPIIRNGTVGGQAAGRAGNCGKGSGIDSDFKIIVADGTIEKFSLN